MKDLKSFILQHKYIMAAFIFCYSIIIVRVINVPLKDAGKARDAIHGDAYSDLNTYSALCYFYDFGFKKSSFLPVHGYDGTTESLSTCGAYTHYPALPDILAGFYAKILHTKNEKWIRIFPVLISIFFFFFIFYFLNRILPDKKAAAIGAMVLVLSNYFIFWADNLHKHLYEELFKWMYVYLIWLYHSNGAKKKHLIIIAGFIYLLVTNVSFEPIVYLAVVTVAISYIYSKKIICWENFVLLLMPLIGLALHFYQNVSYFHSFHAALADMQNSFELRTLGTDIPQNELKKIHIDVFDYLMIPLTWMNRIERFFLIPGPAFLIFAFLGLKSLRNTDKRLFQLGIALIIATVSWNFVMTQHAVVHIFTAKHIGLFYGFVIGYGLLEYKKILIKHWSSHSLVKQAVHVLFIGYIVTMLLSQQLFDFVRYGFMYKVFF